MLDAALWQLTGPDSPSLGGFPSVQCCGGGLGNAQWEPVNHPADLVQRNPPQLRKDPLTVSSSYGEFISTWNPDHLLTPQGASQQVNSQVLLIVPNTKLSALVGAEGQQAASLWEEEWGESHSEGPTLEAAMHAENYQQQPMTRKDSAKKPARLGGDSASQEEWLQPGNTSPVPSPVASLFWCWGLGLLTDLWLVSLEQSLTRS